MKRIVLIAILFCLCISGFAQDVQRIYQSTRIGLYGGAGLATSHNYDVGTSFGLDFDKTLLSQTHLGALVFLQGYNVYYDNEANMAKNAQGSQGYMLRHSSKYIFIAPQLKFHMWHRINFTSWVTVSAGVGLKMSGYDSVRKFNHSFDSLSAGRYDSTIDASKNLNSMLFRLGITFTQDIYVGHNFWFTIKEDIGLLTSALTKTTDIDITNPARTIYTPNRVSPAYVSLQIGIAYIRPKKAK